MKYRYQASLWCEVTDGKEEVVATLDYDSDRTIFVERKDRCHVYTIAQQKDHQLLDRQIADVKDDYARGQREFWCPRCQSAVKVSAISKTGQVIAILCSGCKEFCMLAEPR